MYMYVYIYFAMFCSTITYTVTVVTQVGDQIVSIDGESTEGLTHSQAVEQLKAIDGTIRLEVVQGESTVGAHAYPHIHLHDCRRCMCCISDSLITLNLTIIEVAMYVCMYRVC